LFEVNNRTFHPKDIQDLPTGPLEKIKNKEYFYVDTIKYAYIFPKTENLNKIDL